MFCVLTASEIKASLPTNQWHTLTVEPRGHDIKVLVDRKVVFAGSDKTYADQGKIGVWIKADSLTYFDDLTVEELR